MPQKEYRVSVPEEYAKEFAAIVSKLPGVGISKLHIPGGIDERGTPLIDAEYTGPILTKELAIGLNKVLHELSPDTDLGSLWFHYFRPEQREGRPQAWLSFIDTLTTRQKRAVGNVFYSIREKYRQMTQQHREQTIDGIRDAIESSKFKGRYYLGPKRSPFAKVAFAKMIEE